MLTRKIGYGLTSESRFEFRMAYVGAQPPDPPEDPGSKPAVSWVWAALSLSELIEHITNSAIARSAVIGVWEAYKRAPEAFVGMMPVIRIGEPAEVQSNGRTFFSPSFTIVGWIAREDVALFRDRPAMCQLPSLEPARLVYTPVTPQIAAPAERLGRAPAPVRDATPDIDDQIPF
jgi:hypothetical protein